MSGTRYIVVWKVSLLVFIQSNVTVSQHSKSLQNHRCNYRHLTQLETINAEEFLSDPGIPGVRSMGPGLSNKLTRPFADLTDVTLADEDTNSILADNDNRAIQGNVAMQVAPPGDQIWIKCKWRHLMTKFGSNASFRISTKF